MRDSSFQHQPRLGRALFLLAGQISIVVVLHRLGRYSWMRVDWDDLGDWLDQAPAEDVLLASARMVALVVAWWLLLSTVFYVVAAFAGWQRGLRTMRWAMVPGVGRLLDSMLAISLTSTPAIAAMVVTTPAASVQEVDPSGEPVAVPQPGDDDMAYKMAIYQARSPLPPGGAAPGGTYTVQAGDCLWEIAESQLGDPARWREIWELNRSRLEAAGYSNPDVIHIGWELQLPGAPGATAPAPATAPAGPATSDPVVVDAVPMEVTVEQGDHLWSIAEDRLEAEWGRQASDAEIAPYWTEVVEANRDRLAPPGDPNLIHPGQQIVTPPPPADPLAPPPPPPPPVPASDTGGGGASADPTPADPGGVPTHLPGEALPTPQAPATPATTPTADTRSAADAERDPVPVSVGLLSGGVGVAGMLMTLDRVRQSYVHRRGQRRLDADEEALARAEDRLRQVADLDAARLLDAALRAAAAGSGGTLPALRWVEATRDEVALSFLEPAPVTLGFAAEAADRWRTVARADELDALGQDVVAPAPCLAAVGTTGDGVSVLTDLAAHGVVSVAGEDARARAWLRALAVSVVACPWSSSPTVVLVGFDDALTRLSGVTVVRSTLSEAVPAAEEMAAHRPVLVLSADAPTSADKRPLIGLTTRYGQQVAVVCPQGEGEPVGSVCSIDPAGYLRLSGVDTPVRAAELTADDTELVAQLLLRAAGSTASL